MGIKKLSNLIKDYSPGCIQRRKLQDYNGKIIGIDLSIYLYRFSYREGNPCTSILMQAMRLMKNGALPVYFIDGKPPKEKEGELMARADKRNEATESIDFLKRFIQNPSIEVPEKFEKYRVMSEENLENEIVYINNSLIQIPQQTRVDIKKMFDYMGIPYIEVNGEAEALCAKLNREGYIDGCMSEDTDILANGGKIFIRGFANTSNYVDEYNLEVLLRDLGVDYKKFVDICIMCGCDYTGTIGGISYATAFKYIKKEGDIETIVKKYCVNNQDNKIYYRQGFETTCECDYERAREMFLEDISEGELKKAEDRVEFKQPNVEELLKLVKVSEKVEKQIRKNLPEYYWKLKDLRLKNPEKHI